MFSKLFSILAPIFFSLPSIVQQVEADHNDKGGLEKQKLARDLIMDGAGLATAILPAGDKLEIDGVTAGVNALIDGTVAIANATGAFQHKDAGAAAAAPASK